MSAPVKDKKIPLVEKFGPTIQGEGATIGLQTYFLRFGLCDYECVMCDSMHAVDPIQVKNKAMWLTQKDIALMFDPSNILRDPNPTRWITFSGGNPCIHDLSELVDLLHQMNYLIAVETQGTMYPDWLLDVDLITVSPKSPGMGEKFEPDKYRSFIEKILLEGARLINTKVVIFSEADIDFAEKVAEIWSEWGDMEDFYLSQGNPFPPGKSPPIGTDLHVNMLREQYLKLFDIIKTRPTLTLCKWLPQWHVWLWSNKAGV